MRASCLAVVFLFLRWDAEAFRAPTSIPISRVQRMAGSSLHSRVFMQAASPLAQLGDKVTTLLVSSPLYPIMVKKARETMKKTAEGAGIDWEGEVAKVRDIDNLEATFKEITGGLSSLEWNAREHTPDYYRSKFHAYSEGNLCWDAAFEQLVAGKGVGVRNFPAYGKGGEEHMRMRHEAATLRMGVTVPAGGSIVDLGCGTGTSSRRLAALFPQVSEVIGIDLSPHFLTVAKRVGGVGVLGAEEEASSSRVSYRLADMTRTGLPAGSAALVSACLVIHELPAAQTAAVFREAYRLLAPGGFLTVMEMDPESPGFARLRSNALLFSLIRSTEPFLDQYFELASGSTIHELAFQAGFSEVRREAATGRHFSLVAVKREPPMEPPVLLDGRFFASGAYAQPDTHM